jgi:chromosome segregation ATPase
MKSQFGFSDTTASPTKSGAYKKPSSFTRSQPTAALLDPDVEELHDQIEETERQISTLKSEIKGKTALYGAEIERLHGEIAKKKIEIETRLSEQREDHIAILKDLQEQQQQEVDELHARLEDAIRQQRTFHQHHNDVIKANRESELTTLRNQLERKRIKLRDQEFAAKQTSQQDKMEQQQREAELKAQIEILDAEINEVAASRNEELQRARVQVDETGGSFETRQREQKAKIDRYSDEIAKRRQQFEERLAALEAQKKLEDDQLQSELRATTERLQGLQQLSSKMEKRNNREVQLTQQDMEKLNDAISQSKQREADQLEEAKEQIAKLQEAQHENIGIEQELIALRQKIDQIKKDNADMRKERQRMDTLIYSSRISKHRSNLR